MSEAGRARDGRPTPVEVVTRSAHFAGVVTGERPAADDCRPRLSARRRAERVAERVEARHAAVPCRVETLEAGRLLVMGGGGGGGSVGRRRGGRRVRAHRGRARQSIQRT